MSIASFSVRRPVTVIMIALATIILGAISLTRLPQELFPPITYPQITVVTTYENAAPEEVETLITKPIEEAMGTVTNLKRISSISREGLSLVIGEFGWDTNMDFASLAVREKIDLVKERLPRDAQEPVVVKFNPFDLPIMTIVVTGDRGPFELRQLAERAIKEEIEKLEGVAQAVVTGGMEREILVELDHARLVAAGVPVTSVTQALERSNLNYPAGTIKESFYEYLVRTLGEFQSIKEIENLPIESDAPERLGGAPGSSGQAIASGQSRLIYLRDIAEVRDTLREQTAISRYNGTEAVTVAIQKQAAVNTLAVAASVRKTLARLNKELPQDITVRVTYDQSVIVERSLGGVRDAALEGALLAFFVLLVFLRNVRLASTVITITPLTILACFSLMYFRDITLNVMSLGGLAIGVGMLIDNAIVIIESISRHTQAGAPMRDAAVKGSDEVMMPMSASTLTTISVFLPIIFVVGVAGQLFKDLAWVVVVTQVVSLVLAFVLLPCLANLLGVSSAAGRSPFWRLASGWVDSLEPLYAGGLRQFIRWRWIALSLIVALFAMSLAAMRRFERELLPRVDEGQFIVRVNLAPGMKLETTDEMVRPIEQYALTLPEISDLTLTIGSSREGGSADYLETLGPHQAQLMINLKRDRARSTREVIHALQEYVTSRHLADAEVEYLAQESVFSSAFQQGAPVVLEITGADLAVLRDLTAKVAREVSQVTGAFGVKEALPRPSPETKIFVNRDKALTYSLSVVDVARTAQIGLGGYVATQYKEAGKEVDVRVRFRPADRQDINTIRRMTIHSPLGLTVPLSELAYFGVGRGPSEIRRQDQERTVTVTAQLFRRSLSDVSADILDRLTRLEIPKGYVVSLAGERGEMEESFRSLYFALALALLLVYMIMAAQFESLYQPFIIMFTIPLSLIGIAVALGASRTPINVVVLLGIIMQGGVVVNNGIILIDYANLLRRERSLPLAEAVIEAGRVRLRPILMTAFASALGLMPLALGWVEGSELESPLAITVMGGLLGSTFLTLLVIPTIYLMTERVFRRG